MQRKQGAFAPAAAVVVALAAAGAGVGCGEPIVHVRPEAEALASSVAAVVLLPPRLGFGRAAEQRRAARRTGDTLIDATGGHAILADELPSLDPERIADGVRELGEDPRRTLTLAIVAARSDRAEVLALPPVPGLHRPIYRYTDFTVRLDVRRADGSRVIASIETLATIFTNASEIDGAGRPQGLQQAIDEAVRRAVAMFAPGLPAGAPFAALVEAPVQSEDAVLGGALGAVDKLRRLQSLYPERPPAELATLASGNARFLVVTPGRLGDLGFAPGDLVSSMGGGRALGSRAALARAIARGATPAMSVERNGARFLVGQTLIAKSSR